MKKVGIPDFVTTLAGFLILLFAFSSGGCAAPGSALGRIGLSGLISENERPPELKVKAVLPETYGLGGLDRFFGKPSDYGNMDHIVVSEVDEKGEFVVSFGPIVYHASFWLIPPLGFYPKFPPDPYIALGFSNVPEQVYFVQMRWGKIRYEVWKVPDKSEIPIAEAYWRIADGVIEETVFESDGRKLNGKILKLKIAKQRANKTDSGSP